MGCGQESKGEGAFVQAGGSASLAWVLANGVGKKKRGMSTNYTISESGGAINRETLWPQGKFGKRERQGGF